MNSESSALKLIELYLHSSIPPKGIALAKLRIESKIGKINDPLLREVEFVRSTVHLLEKKRKLVSSTLASTHSPAHIQALKQLSPSDFLILLSQKHFPISPEILSLALHIPKDSLLFRAEQLQRQFGKFRLTSQDLDQILLTNNIEGSDGIVVRKTTLLQRFQNLPFLVRFATETTAIILGLIAILWAVPAIRNSYENSIQKRINDYLIENSLVDSPAPSGTQKTGRAPDPAALEANEVIDEATTKSSSNEASSRKQPKVNEGEVWRFSFTGSATSEVEGGIIEIISKRSTDKQKPLTVPGGIQFDFLLPVDQVIPLKTELEQKVAEIQSKADSTKQSPMSLANLSWYKKKTISTRKIPANHVQVVIWISTL